MTFNVTKEVKTVILEGEDELNFLNEFLLKAQVVNNVVTNLVRNALEDDNIIVAIIDYPKKKTLYILKDSNKKVFAV